MLSKSVCLQEVSSLTGYFRRGKVEKDFFLLSIFSLILLVVVLPVYSSSFDNIALEDLKSGDYSLERISLNDLENREIIFLKTTGGSYSKLQITYTKSYSRGSTVYSVSILKGTTYSSSGDILATFEDVQLLPQTRISVITGTSSSDGEITLTAEVPSYQVQKIIYHLKAQNGAMFSRSAGHTEHATITIQLENRYYAAVYLDEERLGSVYSSHEKSFNVEDGWHQLKITSSGYKDWEKRIWLHSGEKETYTVTLKEEIDVKFSYTPDEPKAGETVSFDASRTEGDITSYEWDWNGDRTYASETTLETITHTFEKGGYFAVVLKVTDSDGDTAEEAKTVYVEPPAVKPPVADFSYTADAPGVNYHASFDSSESSDPDGKIVRREWSFGDGKTITTNLSYTIDHPYAKGGTYRVTLTVIDDDGESASTTKTIVVEEVNAHPTAGFTYSVLSKSGAKLLIVPKTEDRVLFDPSASSDPDGEIASYDWDWDSDGSYDDSTKGTIEHRFAVPGDHDVTLRVTDNKAATDTVQRTVHVDPLLAPPEAAFSFSPSSPTTQDSINFIDSSTDDDGKIISWSWDFGDGKSSTEEEPAHRYEAGKSYTVTLVVEDNDGQTGTVSRIISVNAVPRASFEFATLSASGAKLLIVPHVGDRICFDPSASSDPDGKITKYEWDWDSDGIYDNAITTGTIEYTFDRSGGQRVSLRVTDDKGAADTVIRDLDVPPPVPQFSYEPATPTIRDTVSFTGSVEVGGEEMLSYSWDFGEGSTSQEQNPKHKYNDKGTYTVTLTVTGHDNLTERFSQQITVKNLPPEADFTYHTISEGGAKLLRVPHVGDAVGFDAFGSSDPDGKIVKYEWDWESDETYDKVVTSKTIEHRFETDGTSSVTLRVTDNDGEISILTKEVSIVNDTPEARFDYDPASPSVKDEISFNGSASSDPDGEIVSWEWNLGDGRRKSGQTVTHTYESPGDYEVTLTIHDNAGATDVEETTILITPLAPPVARFEIHPDSPTTQDTISFVDGSEDRDGEIVSWEWDFGDGENATGKRPSHSYVDDGPYTVTLTVTDNDDLTDTASQEITVENIPPKARFTVSPERRIAGAAVTFDASSSQDLDGSIKTYEWDFNDDAEVDMTGSLVTYVFEHGGTFVITLRVIDDDVADASIEQDIRVHDLEVEPREMWGLIIGVAEYPELFGADLTYTAIDAQAVYDFLIGPGGLEEDHVKLLLNDRATLSRVRGGLGWLKKRAQPDDLVIFYFSGHGYQGEDDDGDETDGTDEFLVFYDTQQGFIESTAFRDDEFGEFLDKVNSEHVLVLFDSCYSGGASRGIKGLQSGAKPLPGYVDIFHDFSLEGKLILSASTEAQKSWEDPKLSHGVFTYFLLQGLEGEADKDKNYRITAQELYDYVARAVEDFVQTEKGESQRPQLTGKGSTGVIVSTMNQPPQTDFAWDPQGVIREGDEVVFHDKSADKDGQVASWEWDFGDDNLSDKQDPTHLYSEPGTYHVSLVVTDSDGATAEISNELVVIANQPANPAFTWLPEYPFVNETVYFIDSSTDPDGKIVSWEWSFGDGNESTEPVPTHEYLQQGKYPVTLMVTDDSGATSTPFTVEISITKTSFVRRFIKDKGYLISLMPVDRERARVNAPVWIYTRSIEGGILIEDIKAEGVITSLHPLLVEITRRVLPLEIIAGDLVRLDE